MAVTVVEWAQSGYNNGGATITQNHGLIINSTPQPGDVLVIAVKSNRAAGRRTVTGITGCAATWTEAFTGSRISFWIGTDGSQPAGIGSPNALTASLSGAGAAYATVYLIRGLTDATFTSDWTTATGTALTGPELPAGQGQIALSAATSMAADLTFPSAEVPAGWTAGTAKTGANAGSANDAYHIPSGAAVTHRADLTASSAYQEIGTVVVGTLGDTTPTTTVDTGVRVGLDFTASPVAATTLPLPVAVGLDFDAASLSPTTLATGAHVDLDFAAESTQPTQPTTLTTGAAVALTFDATSPDASEPLNGGEPTYLELVTVPAELLADPPLALPPAGMAERVMTRQSVTLDPTKLVPDAQGRVRAKASDYTITRAPVGTPHLIVDGRDVTYFRDIPTPAPSFETNQPFGDVSASLKFPQITPLDTPGAGDLAWLRHEAPVEILLKRDDGSVTRLWAGHLIADDTGHDQAGSEGDWQAHGALYQASLQGHRVPITLDPTDIGTVIPRALNGVVSRRYPAIPQATTGILTTQRGSYTDSELAYTQELLATAWTGDERQWTLAKRAGTDRSYVMALKDRTTVQWTVTVGTPGLELRLARDTTSIVRCIYGRGVRTDGYSWAGWVWPSLLSDDAPDYPFTNPDRSIHVGDTDATTDTGEGISQWQARAAELGYGVSVDGSFSSADSDVARQIQRRYGLLVDGVVGPQTWAATFAVGSHAGDLSGAFRMPLAVDTRVEPNRYASNGRLLGDNPNYDPSVLRIEREIDYGTGVTKAAAKADAQRQINRDADPAWIGTVTLHVDPREDSRYLIKPGDNLRILGWQGGTLRVHVVGVKTDLQAGTVTLDVDEHARDALTLAQIRQRNRDSRVDPARRPGNVNRRSRNAQDLVVEYDGESGAGVIPRHAIRQGLWTVIYIPVSQVGHAAKIEYQSTSPTSKFVIALFANPIEPAHLVNLVGDPLSGTNPFARSEAAANTLDQQFGLIEAFGGPGQACGYWPGTEGDSPLTGKLLDTGGFEYVSNHGGWVWVAEYSPISTFVKGRIYPAPMSV